MEADFTFPIIILIIVISFLKASIHIIPEYERAVVYAWSILEGKGPRSCHHYPNCANHASYGYAYKGA